MPGRMAFAESAILTRISPSNFRPKRTAAVAMAAFQVSREKAMIWAIWVATCRAPEELPLYQGSKSHGKTKYAKTQGFGHNGQPM